MRAMPIYVETAGADLRRPSGRTGNAARIDLVSNLSGGNLSASVVGQAFTDEGASAYRLAWLSPLVPLTIMR